MKKQNGKDHHPIYKSVVNFNMIGPFFDFSTLLLGQKEAKDPKMKKNIPRYSSNLRVCQIFTWLCFLVS